MTRWLIRLRAALAACALVSLAVLAAPSAAQQPSSVNPDGNAVKEQQLLQELNRIQGRVSIPDSREGVLIQPAGQAWRHFHEVTLRWIGAIAILGMLGLLVLFYATRGMVRIEGGRAGRTLQRFNAAERTVHWMTASCFVVLALSGLNITFGKELLLPLIGPAAFSAWAAWAKYAHNYLSFPFTLGAVVIFLMWVAWNIPNRVDIDWLKQGGGVVGDKHPPAKRFNAGQKLIYWIVVVGGGGVAATGYLLLFPFYATDIAGMQLAQIVHGTAALLFIAAMLGHIYIGTIGMEGAFEAMGTGQVDLAWAKQHHRLWVEDELKAGGATPPSRAATRPAE